HHRTEGTDAAIKLARARRGKHFDPTVVDAFCDVAGDVLGDPSDEPDWRSMIDNESSLQQRLTDSQFDAALEAIADFTDLRSASRAGHSRGLAGPAIPATARVLAATCAYRSMIESRPHRPALTAKQAAIELRSEVRAGRLDAHAVDAVLAAAGQPNGKRRSGPAGLTPREIEVLALIARGATTRQVAQRLEITPKTAETHIERIYTKTGASTRSTATLFAMQHGLLDTLEPLDL